MRSTNESEHLRLMVQYLDRTAVEIWTWCVGSEALRQGYQRLETSVGLILAAVPRHAVTSRPLKDRVWYSAGFPLDKAAAVLVRNGIRMKMTSRYSCLPIAAESYCCVSNASVYRRRKGRSTLKIGTVESTDIELMNFVVKREALHNFSLDNAMLYSRYFM